MKASPLILVALAALGGCATTMDVPDAPDELGSEPMARPVEYRCDAAPVRELVGQTATQDLGEQVLRASGAKTLRWGPPDSAWTMDYREDRVNVKYDRDMTVTAVTCG